MDCSEPKPGVLGSILIAKRERLERLKRRIPPESLLRAARRRAPRDFLAALSGKGIAVIAELKKASPSAGVLRRCYRPAAIARAYERAGAAALSVLTEERCFRGSLEHFIRARAAVRIPVLRKDFIVDDYQILESAAAGADAVLLIASILSRRELAEMVRLCYKLRVCPLVEIHRREEIGKAVASGARVLGINNRNLRTLRVDIATTAALAGLLPRGRLIVSESGIKTPGDLRRLAERGIRAALVGERLLAAPHPGKALAELICG